MFLHGLLRCVRMCSHKIVEFRIHSFYSENVVPFAEEGSECAENAVATRYLYNIK